MKDKEYVTIAKNEEGTWEVSFDYMAVEWEDNIIALGKTKEDALLMALIEVNQRYRMMNEILSHHCYLFEQMQSNMWHDRKELEKTLRKFRKISPQHEPDTDPVVLK